MKPFCQSETWSYNYQQYGKRRTGEFKVCLSKFCYLKNQYLTKKSSNVLESLKHSGKEKISSSNKDLGSKSRTNLPKAAKQ